MPDRNAPAMPRAELVDALEPVALERRAGVDASRRRPLVDRSGVPQRQWQFVAAEVEDLVGKQRC